MVCEVNSSETIFIEHCNDLFAAQVHPAFILVILHHCRMYPDNTYVFQTKNPIRYRDYLRYLPPKVILGTTIETNRSIPGIGKAPDSEERFKAFAAVILKSYRKFITIEPVINFDADILSRWIGQIRPEFLNLGADSKKHNLPEPSIEKINTFVAMLRSYGIELREKHNLERLRK